MNKIKTMSATSARTRFFGLIDEISESSEPVLITTKRNNAVLVGEDDWNAIQETLYLMSIPGMRESLLDGAVTPDAERLSKEEFFALLEE